MTLGLFPPSGETPKQQAKARLKGTAPQMACRDNLRFMEELADESMKLIVTSPPYNIGKDYEKKAPLEAYIRQQEAVVEECARLLHPAGSICWQTGNYIAKGEITPLDAILYPVFKSHGFKLRNRIVWHFEHGLHCTKRLSVATKRLAGGRRAIPIRLIWMRFAFRLSTPISGISKGRRPASCLAIQRGKTPATCGYFQM